MIKTIGITILTFICAILAVQAKVLKAGKIFYYDDHTVKGKKTYRELNNIGEDPWSKPEKLDIILYFNKHVYVDGDRIEILIEEQYEPRGRWKKSSGELVTKTWVPHQVVFSGIPNANKSDRIVVKNIPYQTAFFWDSNLYIKDAFRVVGVFYDKNSK